jgi:signal transduction histidine kinase
LTFRIEAGNLPPSITTDHDKLFTILRNLVDNAVKFTQAGSVTMRIDAGEDAVAFAVTDTGPGIDPNIVEKLFQPFRQLDGSSTRTAAGIGLGLALSRRLAHLLGGDLAAHSAPGAGATFTLTLPLTPGQPSARRTPAAASPSQVAA